MQISVKIAGMSCQHCVMRVKKAIEGLNGVTSLEVAVGQADITFDETKIRKEDIETAIAGAGYKVLG